MKLSHINRFIRVNLVGLLALLNLIAVFQKFKIERPSLVVCKCKGVHAVTNAVSIASMPSKPLSVAPLAVAPVPASHKVNGDWEGDLKEVSCDYTSAIANGVPILQTGSDTYYKRGDLTMWGRIKWIGADYFTTDKCLVRLGGRVAQAFNQGGIK